jgi:hypothetical protein
MGCLAFGCLSICNNGLEPTFVLGSESTLYHHRMIADARVFFDLINSLSVALF